MVRVVCVSCEVLVQRSERGGAGWRWDLCGGRVCVVDARGVFVVRVGGARGRRSIAVMELRY